MRIVCWQTIPIKYHTLFIYLGKKSQYLSSAAVVIGALRFKLKQISLLQWIGCKTLERIQAT